MARMPWWNDADAEFDEIAGHLNALNGRMVDTARWLLDHPQEWQGDGVWTPEAYICWRTGVARPTAAKIVDVARRTDELPECVAAMRRGELSLDQVAPIARHAPEWADTQMVGLAPHLMVNQISKVARSYGESPASGDPGPDVVVMVDVDGDVAGEELTDAADSMPDAAVAAPSKAIVAPDDHAWFGWGDDGRFRLHLEVGADSGGLIEKALEECTDRLFHERTDTRAVGVVDAVLEMSSRSLDAIPAESRRNRFRANVFIDSRTGSVTDHRGRPLAAGPAERITCDTLLSPIQVVDGVPVSVGRSQHIVPDRTRRLVEHRDGGCRVPGCHTDRFVEVHHIIHWSRGGPTDTPNLICLCAKHHRLHHQGKLDITGDADRPPDSGGAVTFTDRHGRPIRSSGASPIQPDHPPPPITGTYVHPTGERLDTSSLHLHEPSGSTTCGGRDTANP